MAFPYTALSPLSIGGNRMKVKLLSLSSNRLNITYITSFLKTYQMILMVQTLWPSLRANIMFDESEPALI